MSAGFFFGILSLTLPMCSSADFKPPDAAERLKAIGPTDGLEESLRRALDPGDDFQAIPAPKPMDWLASHSESGQTFEEFAKSKPRRPQGARRKIYLLPLGEFPEEKSPPLEGLKEYTTLYFGLKAEVLPLEKIISPAS